MLVADDFTIDWKTKVRSRVRELQLPVLRLEEGPNIVALFPDGARVESSRQTMPCYVETERVHGYRPAIQCGGSECLVCRELRDSMRMLQLLGGVVEAATYKELKGLMAIDRLYLQAALQAPVLTTRWTGPYLWLLNNAGPKSLGYRVVDTLRETQAYKFRRPISLRVTRVGQGWDTRYEVVEAGVFEVLSSIPKEVLARSATMDFLRAQAFESYDPVAGAAFAVTEVVSLVPTAPSSVEKRSVADPSGLSIKKRKVGVVAKPNRPSEARDSVSTSLLGGPRKIRWDED